MPGSLVRSGPRRLGEAGPDIGPLAYGCWRLTTDDIAEATDLMTTALDAGMKLVDTADVYGFDHGGTGFGACEEVLGRVLKAEPELRDSGDSLEPIGDFVDLTIDPPRATTTDGRCPPMYFGGFSEAAKETAAAEADVFLTWPANARPTCVTRPTTRATRPRTCGPASAGPAAEPEPHWSAIPIRSWPGSRSTRRPA